MADSFTTLGKPTYLRALRLEFIAKVSVLVGLLNGLFLLAISSVLAHPTIDSISNKDIDALEEMVNSRLSGKNLSKAQHSLSALRKKPRSKASFGSISTPPSHEFYDSPVFWGNKK